MDAIDLKKDRIAKCFREIMITLGLDLKDDSLEGTPDRVARMYIDEWFYGLNDENFPKIMTVKNKMKYNQMLVERDVKVHSVCIAGDQTVNAVSGRKKASSIREGDELWTLEHGIPKKTTVEKITKTRDRNIIAIELENEIDIEVTPDHPIMTKEGWKEAGLLKVGTDLVEFINGRTLCKKQYRFNIGKDLGYFVGAIAADGSIQDDRRICLEVNEEWFAEKVQKAAEAAFGIEKELEKIKKPSGFRKEVIDQFRYRITSSQIAKRVLKLLKLEKGNGSKSKTKKFSLPDWAKYNSEFRAGFLEGYIDGDGHKNGYGFGITTSNKLFAEQLSDFMGNNYRESKKGIYELYVSKKWFKKHGFDKDTLNLDLGESEFLSIKKIEYKRVGTVYAFKCKEYSTFLVEGILTHNCEHHFVPIVGVAHVAYIPNEKVIGLSKINRIVDYFSRRPQIQERLTEDIHRKLCEILDTKDVAVVIDAKHFCVITRGIKDVNSSTVTSKVGGAFEEYTTRKEFLDLIK